MPTSNYSLRFEEQPEKDLAKLDQNTRLRIIRATYLLSQNPRPPKAKKIVGFNYWRIRVGDYRVIYEIRGDELVILVIRIGHRRNVYRGLPKD
ncbi:MAG: type II toxin-antitoxin system RelE family toxin [Micrococcales bacterium]